MARETRAIILLFEGNEVPIDVIGSIGTEVGTAVNASGDVTSFVFSAAEIAKAILGGESKVIHFEKPAVEAESPADEAMIYLGNLFKSELEKTPTVHAKRTLASAILNKINANPASEDSRRITNALHILSEENLDVSKAIMKKYHFTPEKIAVIKKTYNLLSQF